MRRYSPYPHALAPQPDLSLPGLAGLTLLVAVPVLGRGLAGPAAAGLVLVAALATAYLVAR